MRNYRNIVHPETRQAFRRQKIALTARIRENWQLKVISLVAAVCLNVFIQNERNPTTVREYVAEVTCKGQPKDTEVDPDKGAVTITLSGPKSVLDQVKPGDVVATALLEGRPINKPLIINNLSISDPKLPHNQFAQLNIDSVQPFKCRLVHIAHQFKTPTWDPKPSQPGFHYDKVNIHPNQVQVSGWQEQVDQVKSLVIDDLDPDAMASAVGKIDGDFYIHARDAQNREVERINLDPPMVHVTIAIVPDPLARLVTISPNIGPLPSPPYNFENVQVEPNRVKITGPKEGIDGLFTLSTAPITLANETAPFDRVVDLAIPKGFKVLNEQGESIETVKVHVVIHKAKTPSNRGQIPPIPPVDPNG